MAKQAPSKRLSVVYIDAIHFSVKEGAVVKKAAYIVLGLDEDGYKDVLGIYIGQNESAKFWLSVLNNVKGRGSRADYLVFRRPFRDKRIHRSGLPWNNLAKMYRPSS